MHYGVREFYTSKCLKSSATVVVHFVDFSVKIVMVYRYTELCMGAA